MIHKIYAITVIIFASCFPCSVLAFKNKQNFLCGVNQSACWLAYNFCQDKTINIFVKQVDLDYWGKSGRNSYKSFKLRVCELIFVHNVSITSVTRLTISFQMIYGNNLRGRLGSVLDYVSYINNFVNEKKSSNYKEIGNFSNY